MLGNNRRRSLMAKAIQFSFERVEKKYLLTPAQYACLCRQLAPYMQEDEYGKTAICNLYYDTEDWRRPWR